jgi:hypothetical protein
MVAAVLLVFPLAALGLAGALARRAGGPERAVLALSAALLLASALASPVAPVHDPWTHFEHLRLAVGDPRRLLDQWDRPGFTLLAAGPAALGIRAARIAAIATALVALAATMRAARALGLSRGWVAGALMLAQYDFFGQGASTMTELPFAAALAIALLGWAEDRPWLVAAGLGWAGITRPEGPAFVAVGALAALARWRRPGPALAAGLPFLLYVAAGSAAWADPGWIVHGNPYRSLVSLRLDLAEIPRSFFFPALLQSQGPALLALEAGGALLAALRPERRLRFLLAPVAVSFVLLTFLKIGATDAWRESRYLVTVAPALALLAAAAVDHALARAPRLAPPALLAAAALAAAWAICWHWGRIGFWQAGLLERLAAAGLSLSALLWLARRAVPPAASLALLLVVPLVSAPPGVLSRHRPDVAAGAGRAAVTPAPATRPADGERPAEARGGAPSRTAAARPSR